MSIDTASIEAENSRYVWGEWERRCKEMALRTASYLTDPVCKSRELLMRCHVIKDLHPDSYRVTNLFRQTLLLSGMAACALLAVVCTLPAMAVRYAVCRLQKEPYLYRKGNSVEKVLQGLTFTLLSWNICYTQGGYEISDGGVLSSPERIQTLCDKILEQDADVVCLYEVFDINTALYLHEKMKNDYAHFYFSMGPRVIGPSSGMFVATKFAVEDPQFLPFPKEALDGRAKNCEKGIFSFDIKNYARIFTTHLQHSEICAEPTPGEVKARHEEMEIMMQLVDKPGRTRGRVVVGDLNLKDEEFDAASWKDRFVKGDTFTEKTWGGDGYCAALMGKKASIPLNLDHNMVVKGTAQGIYTFLIPTGFDGNVLSRDALSDHQGLFSIIAL
jgi:exonuclease III